MCYKLDFPNGSRLPRTLQDFNGWSCRYYRNPRGNIPCNHLQHQSSLLRSINFYKNLISLYLTHSGMPPGLWVHRDPAVNVNDSQLYSGVELRPWTFQWDLTLYLLIWTVLHINRSVHQWCWESCFYMKWVASFQSSLNFETCVLIWMEIITHECPNQLRWS